MYFSTYNHSLVVMDKLPLDKLPQYAQNYLKLIPSCQDSYRDFPKGFLDESYTSGNDRRDWRSAAKNLEASESIKIYIDENEKTQTTICVQCADQACPNNYKFEELSFTGRDPLAHKYSLRTQCNIGLEFQMFYYEVSITSYYPNAVWYVHTCISGIISSICIDMSLHQ